MGTSTDAKISYGVAFEDGYEFPWAEQDLDEWWEQARGMSIRSPWDEQGNMRPGQGQAQVDAYFEARREWWAANPIPVELVNYCSGNYPYWILAVRKSVRTASRGSVEDVLPLPVVTRDAEQAFLQFCVDYQIPLPTGPKWLLSAYWG